MKITEYDIFMFIIAPEKVSSEKMSYLMEHSEEYEEQIDFIIRLKQSLNNPLSEKVRNKFRNSGMEENDAEEEVE